MASFFVVTDTISKVPGLAVDTRYLVENRSPDTRIFIVVESAPPTNRAAPSYTLSPAEKLSARLDSGDSLFVWCAVGESARLVVGLEG